MREQDYESAEVFLKRTFTEELWNSRVYFHLSHLLSSRLVELGFRDRFNVLEKSVQLDPGYTDAVLDLPSSSVTVRLTKNLPGVSNLIVKVSP